MKYQVNLTRDTLASFNTVEAATEEEALAKVHAADEKGELLWEALDDTCEIEPDEGLTDDPPNIP